MLRYNRSEVVIPMIPTLLHGGIFSNLGNFDRPSLLLCSQRTIGRLIREYPKSREMASGSCGAPLDTLSRGPPPPRRKDPEHKARLLDK